MSSLPLSKKLSEDNLFNQLNLPLSSKWPEIKKAYESQTQTLKTAISTAKDNVQKAKNEQKLKQLDTAYHAFSKRLSEENANMHQTKEALKTIGLNETADWDKVNKRFDEIRASQPEQASAFQPQLDVLKKNKTYLESNPALGKRTILTAALVLGAAGVSWAAYNHLSQTEIGDILETVEQDVSAEEVASEIAPILDEQALEQYVLDNSTFEDEMLALLGILPSPALSLTLQYKMQVFSSLVKSV